MTITGVLPMHGWFVVSWDTTRKFLSRALNIPRTPVNHVTVKGSEMFLRAAFSLDPKATSPSCC